MTHDIRINDSPSSSYGRTNLPLTRLTKLIIAPIIADAFQKSDGREVFILSDGSVTVLDNNILFTKKYFQIFDVLAETIVASVYFGKNWKRTILIDRAYLFYEFIKLQETLAYLCQNVKILYVDNLHEKLMYKPFEYSQEFVEYVISKTEQEGR